jgi:hypothetical protein
VVTNVTDEEGELTLEEAFELVAADVRRNETSADLTTVEAVAEAYDTVTPDRLVDYGDRTTAAWRLVLTRLAQPPTRDELCRLLARLASPTLVELTVLEEYWTHRVLQEGYV